MARRRPLVAAGGPSRPPFVAYLRVSTTQQGASGLGLEAQREAIERHVRAANGRLVSEHIEVESGKRNDRPEIAAAITDAKAHRATLIIAKLDRLARNVAFISSLMESGIDFIAADMPKANRLTVHILAAVAEHEREMISTRTKAALAAAKARGIQLGNPQLKAGDKASAAIANAAKKRKAKRKAEELMPFIDAARRAGCVSLVSIAEALTNRGIRTPGGATTWRAWQVSQVLKRFTQTDPAAAGLLQTDLPTETATCPNSPPRPGVGSMPYSRPSPGIAASPMAARATST